ncbi:MAG: hypothetical protein ABJM43_00155 [Paracoccaceae bacterium]
MSLLLCLLGPISLGFDVSKTLLIAGVAPAVVLSVRPLLRRLQNHLDQVPPSQTIQQILPDLAPKATQLRLKRPAGFPGSLSF